MGISRCFGVRRLVAKKFPSPPFLATHFLTFSGLAQEVPPNGTSTSASRGLGKGHGLRMKARCTGGL